ncbi:MAG: IPT/TIG domain-containing protein [Methanoregula sp.]|nr:IPT/TIG domain-containing protein [Methanoregula sp.]
MKKSVSFFIAVSLVLIACVAIVGCSSSSTSTAQTDTSSTITTETTVSPLYTAGDIVKSSTGSTSTGWLIISYDSATDSYTRAFIYKNSDGSWGYRINSNTETAKRSVMEKIYTDLVTHVTVSSIPTQAPTTATTVTTAVTTKTTTIATTTTSASKPSIKSMDPDEGYSGNSVTTTITGNNFVSGATAVLQKSGESSITASDVEWVSATELTATFDIPNDTTIGTWDIVITNPNSQSGKYSNYFMVHEETDDE